MKFMMLILLILLAMSPTAEAGFPGESATARPNVILILVDDLNDYQGSFGGHPQALTPNIDSLAERGTRFVNAHSNIPVCQPSRNSLFTGVYPHDSRDYDWVPQHEHEVLKHNKTLIELFNENGYLTLGTGKLMHGGLTQIWQRWGNDPRHDYGPFPFDGKEMTVTPNVPAPYREIGPIDGGFGRLSDWVQSEGVRGEPGWVLGWDNMPMRYQSDTDRDLTPDELHAEWAIAQLAELAKKPDQPFFMGIGFVRPHTPMYAPDRFFDLYPIESLDLSPWKKNDAKDTHFQDNFPRDAKGWKYYRQLLESYDGDRELAVRHFLQAYLACVSFVDEQIGKVLNALARHPELAENTIVVLTADHGWQMGEKSYLFKNSPWEESTRIPMVISEPNSSAGVAVEQPVSLIDIFPTIADYAQLVGDHRVSEKGAPIGGFSLRPLVEDPRADWQGPEGALSIVGVTGPFMKKWDVDNQIYSYRTERWRYIRYSNGDEELYDHDNDPHEWSNLAAVPQYRETVERLRQDVSAIIVTPLRK